MNQTIGDKIKYFRKRSGKSQFDLEILIGSSPGSLSRIESSLINPTKETIFKIIEELSLTKYEMDYLIGVTAEPVSSKEVSLMTDSLKNFFKTKGVFAYVGDERGRMWGASDSFLKLMQISPSHRDKLIGDHLFSVLFDHEIGIIDRFDPVHVEDLISSLIARNLFWEMGYMENDYWYKRAVQYILSHPVAAKVYNQILAYPPSEFNDIANRTIYFKIFGKSIKMNFSKEPVPKFERFKIIQYYPDNKVLQLLSKLL